MQARANSITGSLEEGKLNDALAQNSKGDNVASVFVANPDSYIIKFATSQRYYNINGGNIDKIEVDDWAKVKFVNKNTSGQVVKEFSEEEIQCPIIANTFTIIPPNIEGYEPEADVISDSSRMTTDANGNKTITIEYYKILTNDDLKFTPYTENNVEKYMIGDGSDSYTNGLIEKNIKSVLNVPETYNGRNVEIIGKSAFKGASNINKVNIKNNIKKVKDAAFYRTYNIKKYNVDCANIEAQCAFGYNYTTVDEFVIGSNVLMLDDTTFNSSIINNLIINSSDVELRNSIGGTIYTIMVNPDNIKYEVIDNVLYSKNTENRKIYMYPSGRERSYQIPDNVTEIGREAFFGSKIKSINIQDTVKSVCWGAFYRCSSLNEVFVNCENIYEQCAFGYCGLKKITIGTNVKFIGSTTFNGDSKVEIIYEGTRAEWNKLVGNTTFNGVTKITCSDD